MHGGCYPADVTTRLLDIVNLDPEAAMVIDALTVIQRELRALRNRAVVGQGPVAIPDT